MFKHFLGIITITLCFVGIGLVPGSYAQTVANSGQQDSGQIRVPDQWDKWDQLDKPIKSVPEDNFPSLKMGKKPEKQLKIRIGPVELVRRNPNYDAPWRPPESYFSPTHERTLSFGIHKNKIHDDRP